MALVGIERYMKDLALTMRAINENLIEFVKVAKTAQQAKVDVERNQITFDDLEGGETRGT